MGDKWAPPSSRRALHPNKRAKEFFSLPPPFSLSGLSMETNVRIHGRLFYSESHKQEALRCCPRDIKKLTAGTKDG